MSSLSASAKRTKEKAGLDALVKRLPLGTQRMLALASEKGPSSLSTRLVQYHGFAQHKSALRDALALCYGQELLGLPEHCRLCLWR